MRKDHEVSDPTSAQIALARRGHAIGATFFAIFGGAWLALWNYRAAPARFWVYGLIAAGAVAILAAARARYRRYAAAAAELAETPVQQRRQRWFHIINVGQWILILIVGNVLANLGLGAWVIPAAILIVGLHFLPLAWLFSNPVLYATAAGFIALAGVYPFVAPGGPADPVGSLGAGLLLWLSAVVGLTRA
jgi:hypothetical protein